MFKLDLFGHKKHAKLMNKRLLPEKVSHDIAFTVHIPTHEMKPKIQSVEQLCSLIKFQRATIVTNTECLGLKAPTMTRPMQIIQKRDYYPCGSTKQNTGDSPKLTLNHRSRISLLHSWLGNHGTAIVAHIRSSWPSPCVLELLLGHSWTETITKYWVCLVQFSNVRAYYNCIDHTRETRKTIDIENYHRNELKMLR